MLRACPPAETVERLRPYFGELGIARLADQTGLDTIGVPCWAAIRPNSRTLAVHHGKGQTREQAMASAVMEAAEFAVSEHLPAADLIDSISGLAAQARPFLAPDHLLPHAFDRERAIHWMAGWNLLDGQATLIPRDLAVIGQKAHDLPGVSRSTGGLASGNSRAEALVHALCELIERDAMTLDSVRPRARSVSPPSFDSPNLNVLQEMLTRPGMTLELHDLTTDLGVPVVKAVIADHDPRRHFDVSAGFGCHPSAAVAAISAVTEACQTRISNISGARDDFMPGEYQLPWAPTAARAMRPGEMSTSSVDVAADAAELLTALTSRLSQMGIGPIVAFEHDTAHLGISVCRLFCAGLEDRVGNRWWRPGRRSVLAATA